MAVEYTSIGTARYHAMGAHETDIVLSTGTDIGERSLWSPAIPEARRPREPWISGPCVGRGEGGSVVGPGPCERVGHLARTGSATPMEGGLPPAPPHWGRRGP